MTSSEGTPERGKFNPILLRWASAGTTLLSLGATYALAVSGYPEAAVATATLGTVSGISVTINVMRH